MMKRALVTAGTSSEYQKTQMIRESDASDNQSVPSFLEAGGWGVDAEDDLISYNV